MLPARPPRAAELAAQLAEVRSALRVAVGVFAALIAAVDRHLPSFSEEARDEISQALHNAVQQIERYNETTPSRPDGWIQ